LQIADPRGVTPPPNLKKELTRAALGALGSKAQSCQVAENVAVQHEINRNIAAWGYCQIYLDVRLLSIVKKLTR
jgi:hypothetical protein